MQIDAQYWIDQKDLLVSLRLRRNGSLTNFAKGTGAQTGRMQLFVCEPPALTRYIKIETKGQPLQICEVNGYDTGKLKKFKKA